MNILKKLGALATAFVVVLALSVSSPAEAASKNAYQKKWGTFATQTFTGSGDDFVDLPVAVRSGIIYAQHSGSSNFIVHSLDSNDNVIDYLVNEIGATDTVAVFGFGYRNTKTKAFEVQADGAWTITIKQANLAPSYQSSGSGNWVMKYQKGAKRVRITHDGSSNFIVHQFCSNGVTNYVMNEIGSYSGRKKLSAGYCILEIYADGNWSFQ